jgi:hypothetical protein
MVDHSYSQSDTVCSSQPKYVIFRKNIKENVDKFAISFASVA